jgi:hypothetical protein
MPPELDRICRERSGFDSSDCVIYKPRMPTACRSAVLAVLLLALVTSWTPGTASPQPATPNQALLDAVTSNPAAAPQLTAQEVAAGAPDSAAPIVGGVVGALPVARRLAVAPRVVSSAIAALAAPHRQPQAPSIACAAIRAVPPEEQQAAVPAIVAAAVGMAPSARLQIAACATEAVPELAAAIAAAALPPLQPELASPPTSPLPGSTIGRDVLFKPVVVQTCASPPCP